MVRGVVGDVLIQAGASGRAPTVGGPWRARLCHRQRGGEQLGAGGRCPVATAGPAWHMGSVEQCAISPPFLYTFLRFIYSDNFVNFFLLSGQNSFVKHETWCIFAMEYYGDAHIV